MSETTLETVNRDINDRVNISLAIGRYLRAQRAFESASTEFNAACGNVRAVLKADKGARFITKVEYSYYLVETNENGDFDISPVEVV